MEASKREKSRGKKKKKKKQRKRNALIKGEDGTNQHFVGLACLPKYEKVKYRERNFTL